MCRNPDEPQTIEPQSIELYLSNGVKVNANYVNAKIGYNILSDEEMKKAGFSNHTGKSWYYCICLDRDVVKSEYGKDVIDTTLNITLPIPQNNDLLDIAVIDEMFGQIVDYQHILEINPKHKFSNMLRDKVEEEIERLQKLGILYGHVRGEYV